MAFGAESFVECSVVRDDAGIAHERSELDSRIVGRRGVCNIFVMNIRQASDLFRDGLAGIDECDEPFDDAAPLHAGGGDLRQLIMILGKPGGFGIEHDDVFVEPAEIGNGGIFLQ